MYRSLKDTISAEEKAKKLEEHRETILLKALTVQSNAEKHTPEVGRYIGELLSYLIASKKLEIKFVTLVNEENWKIVIKESKNDALQGIKIIGGKIIATYIHNASSKVQLHNLDGVYESDLKLPGIGTVGGFNGKKEDKR